MHSFSLEHVNDMSTYRRRSFRVTKDLHVLTAILTHPLGSGVRAWGAAATYCEGQLQRLLGLQGAAATVTASGAAATVRAWRASARLQLQRL